MTYWYFDPQLGSDSNDGLSPLSPKKNPPALSSGDKLFQRRGSTYVRTSQWALGAAANVEIGAYGDVSWGKPVVQVATTLTSAISITGDNTIWRDTIFRGFTDQNNGVNRPNGIVFGSQGVLNTDPGAGGEIYDCEFYDIPGDAIAFNGIGSSSFASLAAARGIVKRCVFDNIGGDAVFAKIKTYFEVSYNRMTRLSTQNLTGDGVGFLDANPVLAWIHHNYIDHREVDSKQCVIIDGTDGSGLAIVEDNYLIGFGGPSQSPTLHTNINVDQCKAIIRRNKIVTSGIGISVNTDGPVINSNLLLIQNHSADGSGTVTLLASNGRVINNTFARTGGAAGAMIKAGAGRSGNIVKSNAVVGADVFFKQGSGSTSSNGNNAFFGTTSPYVDSAGAGLALASGDIVSNLLLNSNYRPTAASPLIGAGAPLDVYPMLDAAGVQFNRVPTIGAFEYIRPRAGRRG